MSTRPSFPEIYMRLAMELSRRSTCKRLQVGTVITSVDYRMVYAVGYNGNANGLPNECDRDEPGNCGCFVSGTPVRAAMVQKAYRRWYGGEVVTVVTKNSDITVTPHHPLLTPKGWAAANTIRKGDHLVRIREYADTLPAALPIEDVFGRVSASGFLTLSPGAPCQFHGDGQFADRPFDIAFADVLGNVEHHLFLVGADILGDLAGHATKPDLSDVKRTQKGWEVLDFLAGLVALDEVIDVEHMKWAGHVFNLQTAQGWYCAGEGGLIAHNCLHSEDNAIINCTAPRDAQKIVFVTHLPCAMCAKRLVNLGGVQKVFYASEYRLKDSLEILGLSKIGTEQLIL